MKTWRTSREEFRNELAPLYPSDEIAALFDITFEEITQKRPFRFSEIAEQVLRDDEQQLLHRYIQGLKREIPIQHLIGKAPFFGMDFYVSADTLIPRPETEELVNLIIKSAQHRRSSALSIIDIGTGTGCIAITLARQLPQSTVTAIDVSEGALHMARKNAVNMEAKVDFIQMDFLQWREQQANHSQRYDIIVSNPPYIRELEKSAMSNNVLKYEPHLALFVADDAPLLFYREILEFGQSALRPEGTIYTEINQYLAAETAQLATELGYNEVKIVQDINGADRIMSARRL